MWVFFLDAGIKMNRITNVEECDATKAQSGLYSWLHNHQHEIVHASFVAARLHHRQIFDF